MHAYIHRGAEQALPAQRPHQARAARADCRGAGAQYIQTYMHASMNAGRQACVHACIQGLLHLGLPQVLPVASQSRLHRQCQAAEAGGIEVSRAPSAGKPTCLHIMCVCVCVCVCVSSYVCAQYTGRPTYTPTGKPTGFFRTLSANLEQRPLSLAVFRLWVAEALRVRLRNQAHVYTHNHPQHLLSAIGVPIPLGHIAALHKKESHVIKHI